MRREMSCARRSGWRSVIFLPNRKECGGFGWCVGDFVELGVVFAELIGDFYFSAGEPVDELEGVDDAFRFVVIVGDDKGLLAFFRNVFHTFGPRFEFGIRIQIVVAFMARLFGGVVEPRVVTAAVEADIANGGCSAFCGFERAADDGLIYVAEADAAFVEHVIEACVVPCGVADFDDERIVLEAIEE